MIFLKKLDSFLQRRETYYSFMNYILRVMRNHRSGTTYEFFNEGHLGDCLFQVLYLRKLASAMPDAQFLFYCETDYHPQLKEVIEDLPEIKLLPKENRTWLAINAWIGAGKYYYRSPYRYDYLTFYIDWFNHMSLAAGLPNYFQKKADFWFDYPALLKPTPLSRHFDFLVVNSVPQSRQFHFDEEQMNHLIARLVRKGYSVVVTNPCSVEGVVCTQSHNISITGIGNISNHCDYHIMVSSGPSWTTFNIWNAATVRFRAILLNKIKLDYNDTCKHFDSVQALTIFLMSNNIL